MTHLTLTVPSDLPLLFKMSDDDFTREMQMLLAVKLFDMGKLTSGKAAELAGISRVLFLHMLERYGVAAINLDAKEAKHEVEAARRLTNCAPSVFGQVKR